MRAGDSAEPRRVAPHGGRRTCVNFLAGVGLPHSAHVAGMRASVGSTCTCEEHGQPHTKKARTGSRQS